MSIEFDPSDPGKIVVRDNAAWIAEKDYARAFKPAEIPPDRTGLSEFGMGIEKRGMLAGGENGRSGGKALNEDVERTISFDVSDIVENKIDELDIIVQLSQNMHILQRLFFDGLHNIPQGRPLEK